MQSDAEYFRKRVREERQAARAANTFDVQSRHLEFAEAYEFRLRETEAALHRSAFTMAIVASFGDAPDSRYEPVAAVAVQA